MNTLLSASLIVSFSLSTSHDANQNPEYLKSKLHGFCAGYITYVDAIANGADSEESLSAFVHLRREAPLEDVFDEYAKHFVVAASKKQNGSLEDEIRVGKMSCAATGHDIRFDKKSE